MNKYAEEGYRDRADYLNGLSDEFGIDAGTVHALASVLGEDEDFDALICALEDIEQGMI